MKTILEAPDSANVVINEYLNMPLGKDVITCPYFMNLAKQRGGLRVLVGKGDAGEIVRETKVLAQLKGVDLAKMSETQLRDFMIQNNIGIDCSGFVVHVLNFWLKNQNDRPLINYLKFKNNSIFSRLKRKLRPVESIGAELMTNELNCEKITDLNKIQPGDLIRSKGKVKNSHHVSLITKVMLMNDIIQEFEYVHSMRYYEDENGIRYGKVKIINPEHDLKDQDWQETKNGKNWTYEGLMNMYEDNGIRRLRNVNLKHDTKHKQD